MGLGGKELIVIAISAFALFECSGANAGGLVEGRRPFQSSRSTGLSGYSAQERLDKLDLDLARARAQAGLPQRSLQPLCFTDGVCYYNPVFTTIGYRKFVQEGYNVYTRRELLP